MSSQEIKKAIREQIHPFMKELFWRIAEGKDALVMDGVWVYNEKAQFVGGKAINLCSYVVTELLEEKEKEEGIHALREIIPMCAELPMQTWGIFNAVKGLWRMEQKGICGEVIPQELWERLKVTLDWRTFVDCENHLALKGYPTNYYGVAFGIARYRELLGWEEEGYSEKLLNRLMEHIELYSGAYEFMDETPGFGRFDRYSILVPAEIANTVLDTGMELPEKIVRMLRKSAAICLFMANRDGYGFSYGRSTGAYGDTGVLEVLTAAARVKTILDPGEEALAYAYCTAIIRRFGAFWIDPEMQSVNMWEKGRKTDSYRNKNRILSENLSLCMQMLEAEEWEKPESGEEAEAVWEKREREDISGMYFPFARGEYERGLAVVRDKRHIWSLPFISGGKEYYEKSPYLPIPYSQFTVTGVPGEAYAYLVPQLILEDGTKAMPIVYFKEIQWKQEEGQVIVSCHQDALCAVGEEEMRPLDGISCDTVYRFSHGQAERTDTFRISKDHAVSEIRMDVLTFSEEPAETDGGYGFGCGRVEEISQTGYDRKQIRAAEDTEACRTPEGRLCYRILLKKEHISSNEISVSWRIRLRESGRIR